MPKVADRWFSVRLGPPGVVGSSGGTGQPGLLGSRGDTGPSGQLGWTGQQGQPGQQGLPGIRGPSGDLAQIHNEHLFQVWLEMITESTDCMQIVRNTSRKLQQATLM